MQLDTIYNLITHVLLYHIFHINNGDICGTEFDIFTKLISVNKHCKRIRIKFNYQASNLLI